MSTKVTYFAIVTERTSLQRPAGVFRLTRSEEGLWHEAFTTELRWEPTGLYASFQRGEDLDHDFVEVSEEDANAFIERLTARVKGESVD